MSSITMTDVPRAVLESGGWFGGLAPDLREALLSVGHQRATADGESAYAQGDEPDGLYCVVEGQIRLINYTSTGGSHLLFLARSGDWFGELSTLDQHPRQQDAVSDGTGLLLHLPISEIERLAAHDGRLWRAIGGLASLHQRMALEHMRKLLQLPVEGRVLTLISTLSAAVPGRPVTITHEQIAFNVGASHQSVNGALQRLKAKGIVTLSYRNVTLK